eukprot:3806321-Amphidinium_carterae.1
MPGHHGVILASYCVRLQRCGPFCQPNHATSSSDSGQVPLTLFGEGFMKTLNQSLSHPCTSHHGEHSLKCIGARCPTLLWWDGLASAVLLLDVWATLFEIVYLPHVEIFGLSHQSTLHTTTNIFVLAQISSLSSVQPDHLRYFRNFNCRNRTALWPTLQGTCICGIHRRTVESRESVAQKVCFLRVESCSHKGFCRGCFIKGEIVAPA